MNTVQEYANLVNSDFKVARAVIKDSVFWHEVIRCMPELKSEVVLNKFLPDDILLALAKDEDADIRLCVAMKRKLPHEALNILSIDENDSVRMAIARNPKSPLDILEKMKNDSWTEVIRVIRGRLGD